MVKIDIRYDRELQDLFPGKDLITIEELIEKLKELADNQRED